VDEVRVEGADKGISGSTVLVVDDVLNTGKTLAYALLPFMEAKSKGIQTLVLVDRNHKSFPVSADYIGMSLSTTLQEHVTVNIVKGNVEVFLS
jgi:pyrimidine operon attenuation protein/uracil phosphoribosyltransferase